MVPQQAGYNMYCPPLHLLETRRDRATYPRDEIQQMLATAAAATSTVYSGCFLKRALQRVLPAVNRGWTPGRRLSRTDIGSSVEVH